MANYNGGTIGVINEPSSYPSPSGSFTPLEQSLAQSENQWPGFPSGLVLYLDAGRSDSYPGSGTAWTDLSGSGNDATLVGLPTFDSANRGSLYFDGNRDYATVSGSTTVSAATFIVWLDRNGAQPSNAGLIFSTSTTVTGLNFWGTTERVGYHWNSDPNASGWSSALTIPQSWSMAAVSVSPSSATAYLGQSTGITSATNTISHSPATLDAIEICRNNDLGTSSDGNLGVAMIYDRALNATEITQVFNVFRGRYGI